MWHHSEIWQLYDSLPEPGEEGYLSAVNALSRHRDKLPGVVNVEIPPNEMRDPQWQGVISRSDDACECNARRWITPTKSRAKAIKAPVKPIVVGGGVQVAFGPKGGDRETNIVQFSVEGSELLVHILPHARVPRNMREVWSGQPQTIRVGFKKLAHHIQKQSQIFIARVVLGWRPVRTVDIPICEAVRLNEPEGLVYLAPDIGACIVNRAGRGALHDCKAYL